MKSKRVLIIIPHLGIGGTEVQTYSLAKALVTNGYSVGVLCLYRHIDSVEQQFKSLGVEIYLLSPKYSDYSWEIDYPSGTKLLKFLYSGLKSTLKKFNPNIIHVQYVTPGATIILILRYILGFNNILATSHTDGNIYSKNGLRIIRFLTNHSLRTFQCITEAAERNYFGESNLFDGCLAKHLTIHNNIPSHISILDKPRKAKAKGENIIVGVVSRLESIKGMDLVIPAFSEVAKTNHLLRLKVIGDGSLRGLMEEQAKESGVTDRIEFIGRKSQSELQLYYDQIDILLMPSRSEGFGLTAIEGMARGCIPIVSNTGGLPEVVSNEYGFLVKVDDKKSLSDTILNISSNYNVLQEMSQKAISGAKKFSFDSYSQRIKQLYSYLL